MLISLGRVHRVDWEGYIVLSNLDKSALNLGQGWHFHLSMRPEIIHVWRSMGRHWCLLAAIIQYLMRAGKHLAFRFFEIATGSTITCSKYLIY